MGHQV
jgi:hypothetical protein